MNIQRIRGILICTALSLVLLHCAPGRAARVKAGAPADVKSIEAWDILAAYYGGHAWGETEYAFARMVTPPSEATRGEAEVIFFAGEFGERVWTNHYFRSKPAGGRDLDNGMVVFFTKFDPVNAVERMKSGWLMGVIQNTDEISRGYISVALYSPGLEGVALKRKSIDNIRLPLEKLTPLTMPK